MRTDGKVPALPAGDVKVWRGRSLSRDEMGLERGRIKHIVRNKRRGYTFKLRRSVQGIGS